MGIVLSMICKDEAPVIVRGLILDYHAENYVHRFPAVGSPFIFEEASFLAIQHIKKFFDVRSSRFIFSNFIQLHLYRTPS
jgi:hypothetical protein